jgi:D-alanyl-D-alanine carboxypeptidase
MLKYRLDMLVKKPKHKNFKSRMTLVLTTLIIVGFSACVSYFFLNEQTIQQQKQAENARILALKAIAATKEAKKKEPVYVTIPGAKPFRAIVEDYAIPGSLWLVVSKTHPISVDYVPAGLKIPNVSTRTDKSDAERSVRSDIEQPLINLFSAASTAGYQLMIGSGYRSAALQQSYYDSSVNSIGVEATNQAIALPGTSEHQTGLAFDVSTVTRTCYLDSCFGTTDDGKWLADNAYLYGFILRYPYNKEDITGYQYEPWHFRYVGIDLATALHESGLTLDEALPYQLKADVTLRQNGAI